MLKVEGQKSVQAFGHSHSLIAVRKPSSMNKDKSLFASIEGENRVMYVYGYVAAPELKKMAEYFKSGIEVKHPQVEIRDKVTREGV